MPPGARPRRRRRSRCAPRSLRARQRVGVAPPGGGVGRGRLAAGDALAHLAAPPSPMRRVAADPVEFLPGASPSSQMLPRQRCGRQRLAQLLLDRAVRGQLPGSTTEGKRCRSCRVAGRARSRAGGARSGGISGAQPVEQAPRLASSGSNVSSGRSGWRRVSRRRPRRVRPDRHQRGALAPRKKLRAGRPGRLPSASAASCATAQCRSQGRVWPADSATRLERLAPVALIGWRQMCGDAGGHFLRFSARPWLAPEAAT